MGSLEMTSDIFEIKNKDEQKLVLFETSGAGYILKDLIIEGGDEFRMSKPLAKKIVRELIKEFKLNFKERTSSEMESN